MPSLNFTQFIRLSERNEHTAVHALVTSLVKANTGIIPAFNKALQTLTPESVSLLTDIVNTILPQFNRILLTELNTSYPGQIKYIWPIPESYITYFPDYQYWLNDRGETSFISLRPEKLSDMGTSTGCIAKEHFCYLIRISIPTHPNIDQFLVTLEHEMDHVIQRIKNHKDPEFSDSRQDHSVSYYDREEEMDPHLAGVVFNILDEPDVKNPKHFRIIRQILSSYDRFTIRNKFLKLAGDNDILDLVIDYLASENLAHDPQLEQVRAHFRGKDEYRFIKLIEKWVYENHAAVLHQIKDMFWPKEDWED